MNGPRRKQRRGHSLIELLVVISVGSALLAVSVGLLHTLLQMQQGGRKHLQQRRTLERLADQFREDVHAATQVRATAAGPGQAEGPGWELPRDPEHTVEYRLQEDNLVRTERQKDKVLRRESFALPQGATVSMETPKMGIAETAPGLVTLRIVPLLPSERQPAGQPRAPGAASPGRTIRVDAALATDHRFLQAKGR